MSGNAELGDAVHLLGADLQLDALVAGADHDAEAEDVGQLLEADRLALHLGPDRKRFLAPAIDMSDHAVLLQALDELAIDLADQVSVSLGKAIEALLDHGIGFRIERAEG